MGSDSTSAFQPKRGPVVLETTEQMLQFHTMTTLKRIASRLDGIHETMQADLKLWEAQHGSSPD